MRVLYGVVGEGMGHATRSAVVLDHILDLGHEVRVVVSGKAHTFLKERFARRKKISMEEIHGLTLRYLGNRLDRKGSLFWNLRNAPKGVKKNIEVYRKIAEDGIQPEVVISDFESWAALYGLRHGVPVVSVDNIQIINRCKHQKALKKGKGLDFGLARLAVKMKVPKAYHYLIATFFFPPVRKKYTTLVPPILRDEVLTAEREPGEHVVIYFRGMAVDELRDILRKCPVPFRVYGADEESEEGNVAFRRFAGKAFLDDLRTARAVVAGGGFSLMSEAVSLGVPMLSVPIEGQFEQELNARYLEHLGYGRAARKLEDSVLGKFLERIDEFSAALSAYRRTDNSLFFSYLDRLLERVAQGKKRPNRLA
ncbi:MAG TPA: glycosyltransferase family protein [Vicinamibacteria bacterium]|nr:glycosyltransferase family protein [Vicinamibacteria bacterium]